jgi:CheY-like chemotaxis protein
MGARILIVEDDADLRELLVLALEQAGYTALPAQNGVEALVHLQFAPRPAVILLNLFMPIMPGAELLELIRLDDALAGIPVVIVTGAPVPVEVGRAADAVLAKPFDLDELCVLIDELIARGTPTPTPPPPPMQA